ncbi:MAG: succinate dehydrogenase, hydrophobic membrane anchor protein [Methylococcales bacterium]|nr:succinate dehydrogenase, hydrophobic membrane anchor protein [Methylococcales bacterium]
MNYRTPLASARGLGSAHSGRFFWWLQRVSAVLVLVTSIWLFWLLHLLLHAEKAELLQFLSSPVHAAALSVWFLSTGFHATQGVQVVVEDYVPQVGLKLALTWLSHSVFFILAFSATFNLIRLSLS